jgi:hypothetical protein
MPSGDCHSFSLLSETLIIAAPGWRLIVPHGSTSDITAFLMCCSILFIYSPLSSKMLTTAFAVCMFGLTTGVIVLLWPSLVNGNGAELLHCGPEPVFVIPLNIAESLRT